jgi:superfamily II DNA/RNA helicase
VSLVVHADPPMEHKAYLHRSGRTARAGNAGTVVTLMLDAQVSDVRDLTRKAGIKPTITRVKVGDPLLAKIAPGERTFVEPSALPAPVENDGRNRSGGRGRSGGGRPTGGRSGGNRGRSANGRSAGQPAREGAAKSSGGGSRRGSSARRGSASRSSTVYSTSSHSAASFSSNRRSR